MKVNLDAPADDVRIEIIPLIDVIFCILTFFILAAVGLTRQQSISVDLPKASTGASQMRDMLIVSINPFGQVYVEQEPMITSEQLVQKLQQYRQAKPEGLLVLYASKTASYNDVVQVLDRMRQVGGDRVSLATLPDATNPAPGANSQIPPVPGVPGLTPNSGANPINPYGTAEPTNPYNPSQPQVPLNPGQVPGTPGLYPTVPGNGALTPTVPGSGVPTPPPATQTTPGANNLPIKPNSSQN